MPYPSIPVLPLKYFFSHLKLPLTLFCIHHFLDRVPHVLDNFYVLTNTKCYSAQLIASRFMYSFWLYPMLLCIPGILLFWYQISIQNRTIKYDEAGLEDQIIKSASCQLQVQPSMSKAATLKVCKLNFHYDSFLRERYFEVMKSATSNDRGLFAVVLFLVPFS